MKTLDALYARLCRLFRPSPSPRVGRVIRPGVFDVPEFDPLAATYQTGEDDSE